MFRLPPIVTDTVCGRDSVRFLTPGTHCDGARDVLSSVTAADSARDGIGAASTKSAAIVYDTLIKVTFNFSPSPSTSGI